MKLIENPIRLSASLHKMLPYTVRYLYGKTPIKLFRLYTLGSVHVHYIDAFNRIDVVMTHDKRTIKQAEIDHVVSRLFPGLDASQLMINHAAKNQMESQVHHKIKMKDIVIIEQSLAQEA